MEILPPPPTAAKAHFPYLHKTLAGNLDRDLIDRYEERHLWFNTRRKTSRANAARKQYLKDMAEIGFEEAQIAPP